MGAHQPTAGKATWFWCNYHGDYAIRPMCPQCEHDAPWLPPSPDGETPLRAPVGIEHGPSEAELLTGQELVALRAEHARLQEELASAQLHDQVHYQTCGDLAAANVALQAQRTALHEALNGLEAKWDNYLAVSGKHIPKNAMGQLLHELAVLLQAAPAPTGSVSRPPASSPTEKL